MKVNTLASDTMPAAAATRRTIRAIVGASAGNMVEWFDFFVYSYCSLYFAHAFFPSGNRTTELLNTAGVFAAGFLMRPVGGWLFGRIADRSGRRKAMLMSVLMMCGGSLAIALLPTYAQIGVAAPALLLAARCVQGLSVGGEYGTSATYMSEIAQAGRRGFFSSFQYVTIIAGQIAALFVVVLLQQWLSHADLVSWGWRIPFALGALGALVAVYLRRSLEETTTARTRHSAQAGTIAALLAHKRSVVTVIGFTAGGSLAYYTFTAYMQKYLVNSAGMSVKTASGLMMAALIVFMFMQPVVGALSDRIGRRRSMLLFGVLAMLGTVPMLDALRNVSSPYWAFFLVVIALAVLSFYTAISGLIKAELFPPEVRALGVGLPYAIANALFGGSAEYAALSLKVAGVETVFFWYVTAACAVVALVAFFMREPAEGGYLRD
ncbi:MFS family transporter [Paraburkholderia unamae]|uniref:MHS family alpha-ketoglutarate permease-like MFS transporter n=1 Tax=Paraburkholderia unamae TaxID=219649 RepID=A0ABX5KDW0_9BURK|nr:MFS family transporter [Paraburkholderia unamae]PVX72780.1 MHS family alpha-ketoglutarate permease-like MFS transporter [Paraburkholderia unamae]